MRAIIALSLLLLTTIARAEDLEQFTLADGRVLIGSYDEAAGKLTLLPAKAGKVRVALSVAPKDIAERKPWVSPEDAARAQEEAERAKRAKAEADADRAKAASLAVRQTIEAQDQRIKDRERQAADKATRELARERAAYWRERGQEFDPLIFSAEEMDEQAAAAQRRKDDEAQRAAAEVAWKLKLEEDKAKAAAVERAQAEQRRIDRATDAERERIIAANKAKDEEAMADERRSEERKRAAVEAAKATAALTGILILAGVVIAAYLVPVIIAFRRYHRFRMPILVLCIIAPIAICVFLAIGGPSDQRAAQHYMVTGRPLTDPAVEQIKNIIVGTVAGIAWIIAMVWSVMPGQGQQRPPSEERPPGRPTRGPRRRPAPSTTSPAPDDAPAEATNPASN